MALPPGSRVGAYEVLGLIGAGGMGEVYRARDARLQRDVAIKILPPAFALDADRLARFEREAQLLASLNHPNIAAIYGFEEGPAEAGHRVHALVLELVEGPTLADRIAQGPVPLDEALPIARQIADALGAAHGHGVIHRDLKPANIKLRPDGTVKVLDFGLAKALDPAAGSSAVSMSPTITSPALMTGGAMILGTAAYMSPEQARGKAVDTRADVWAFGCVLFEMLTGTRAFEDEDVSLTLSKVLRVDAEVALLPADLPPHVAQTIRVCLQKDPARRPRDMHDVRLALDGAFASAASTPSATAMPAPRRLRLFATVAAAAAAALSLAGVAAWRAWPRAEPPGVVRFDYDVPIEHVFRRTGRPVVALSRDGRSIVYNTTRGLFLRSMGELEARLIQGTEEDSANPFFSPDGQSVAYWTNGDQLKRIPIAGGAPVVIAKMTLPFGASWNEDGTILVGQPEGIVRVPATGGTPEVVVRAGEGEEVMGPQLLPDGDTVLFAVIKGLGSSSDRWNRASIVVQSLSSGERKEILTGGADATYVASGHLVYALNDGLFAVAFDPDRQTVSGGPIPLTQGILRSGATGAGNYAISANGTLVYVQGGAASLRTLAWIGRDGRREDVPIEPSTYLYPRISPDGTRIALDDRNDANDLWVWHLSLATRTRLVTGGTGGQYPVWSADSTRIVFDAVTGNIHAKAASNVGQVDVIAKGLGGPGGRSPSPYFLTPSGDEIVFRDQQNPKTDDDILILSLKEGSTPRPLLNGAYVERNAELSPDGRWMAYESNESGRFEIYVRPFPNIEDDRVQVSNAGGVKPLWSRDGRELFYLEPNTATTRLLSVAAGTRGSAFSPGGRTPVLDWPFLTTGEGRTYDVSPDGRRFLGVVEGSSQQRVSQQIVVVEHWIEELKRLVGNQ